jgi:hypothetical protein
MLRVMNQNLYNFWRLLIKWQRRSGIVCPSLILSSKIITRVGTYVQRGSKFCFVLVLVLLVVGESLIKILLYLQILLNFTMLLSLLKILHYCPISPCIQQPCPAALPGCSINFDRIWCGRSLAPQSPHCTTVAGHQTACARCCPERFKLIFSPISPCFHYLHARAAVQQTGSNLFSCSVVLM